MRPTTFFAIAFPFLYRARRSAVRSHVRGISTPWYLCLELGDLVESEFDRGLTFEQRNKHRELTAFGLDFANGSGKPREGTFLDGDGFSHFEVDLGRNFFFFNDTATTEIYTNLNTLSLHDALPI